MLPESQSSPASRFLHVDAIFSNASVARLKETVRKRWQERFAPYKPAFDQFLRWQSTDKEVVVFTMYAYADILLPKQYNCIFELLNPASFVQTNVTITLSLYEGWLPMMGIENGHKHACILRFEDEIPALMELLAEEGQHRFNNKLEPAMLGICNYQDYAQIAEVIQNHLKLKELYGSKWFEHLDDEDQRTP